MVATLSPPARARTGSSTGIETRRRRGTVLQLAAALLGLGMSLVVGSDGSPTWSVIRVALVAVLAGGLVVALGWLRGPSAGALATSAGALLTPSAATIGSKYLTRTGLTVRGAGGLAAAVGAGVLLVGGAWLLLRPARWWGRLIAAPVVLVFGFYWAMPLVGSTYATNLPRPALGHQTPGDRGLSYREVSFRTGDGVLLSGWYIPSTNGAAVAMLHGASSTRSDVLDQAAVVARHGYGVLLFDARGHGRSGGRAMEFGWYGDQDVAAAVTFLQHQSGVDPARIGAVGFSMGGEEAVGAMPTVPGLRAVVGEGVTGRVPADHAWLPDRYGIQGTATGWSHDITYGVAGLLTDASEPGSLRSAVANSHRPVLLIAAGSVKDEQYADEYIRSASPGTVQVWVVPGASHISGLTTSPRQWEQRVIAFLDSSLAVGRR